MDPILGAAAAAGAAGAGIIGGILTNQANARQQTRAQDFMAEMSNTAHRREVADLRAAGLNPILSAKYGGASTPSISPARMENAIAPGINTALEVIRAQREIAGTESQIGLNEATAQAQKAQALTSATTAKQNEANTQRILTEIPALRSEAKTRKGQADWDRKMQDYDNMTKRIQMGLDTGTSAIKMLPGTSGLQIPRGTTLMKNKTGEVIKERNWLP